MATSQNLSSVSYQRNEDEQRQPLERRPQLPPHNLIFFDPRRQLWRRKRFTERRRRILARHGWDGMIEEMSRRPGERFDMRSGSVSPIRMNWMPEKSSELGRRAGRQRKPQNLHTKPMRTGPSCRPSKRLL